MNATKNTRNNYDAFAFRNTSIRQPALQHLHNNAYDPNIFLTRLRRYWQELLRLANFTPVKSNSMGLLSRLASILVFPVLFSACAQIPKSKVTTSEFATLSCAALAEQIKEEYAIKTIADQAKSDSWQAVLPIVVAARYGHATSAANDAERRATLLTERANQLRCAQ